MSKDWPFDPTRGTGAETPMARPQQPNARDDVTFVDPEAGEVTRSARAEHVEIPDDEYDTFLDDLEQATRPQAAAEQLPQPTLQDLDAATIAFEALRVAAQAHSLIAFIGVHIGALPLEEAVAIQRQYAPLFGGAAS